MARFATAINCMDGRAQKPVIEYMQKNFEVDYVDMITEPGPNAILSGNKDADIIGSLKKKVGISVNKHNSQVIAVVAHYDCAGNPVSDDDQKEQLRKALKVINLWGFSVRHIIALWLDEYFRPGIID